MFRMGYPPFLECSSKGDKRFSAFFARIRSRNNDTIESIYQSAKKFEGGVTGLSWRDAKGRKPINDVECSRLYSTLWDEYIAENPDLLPVLCAANGLSDIFGKELQNNQARELWRIRCDHMNIAPAFLAEVTKTFEKDYVCGFAFSWDLYTVYLILKNRPDWQAGKLNGIGGKVDPGETPLEAMIREFFEETGIETTWKDWVRLEYFEHRNGVRVTFFALRLPQGSPEPATKTDEQVQPHPWQTYTYQYWANIGAIENIAYLVNKGACFFFAPESKRMELQNAQDKR